MQQSREKDISVACQRLSITPERRKHGNELKELITPIYNKNFYSRRNLAQGKEERQNHID